MLLTSQGAIPHEIDEDSPDDGNFYYGLHFMKAADDCEDQPVDDADIDDSEPHRRLPRVNKILSHATSIDRVTASAFVLGGRREKSLGPISRSLSRSTSKKPTPPMPYLSYKPTIGRNSKFLDLTEEQREELGGIEYRSLKVLSKIVVGELILLRSEFWGHWVLIISKSAYYVLFHIFGVVCLVGWIHNASRQYKDYLESIGQDKTWWYVLIREPVRADLTLS